MSHKITIAELVEHLSVFDPQSELLFGTHFAEGKHLTFYRTKRRGERLVQIEFNERLEWVSDDLVEVHDD